eukprot:COSAG03_NODE_5271_length_1291_cov_10.411074_1_plen_82_part_00
MDGWANPSSCTGQLDRELSTAQHSHQRIELRDARDAVRQPELRSQFVRWGGGTLARKRFIIRGCLLGVVGVGGLLQQLSAE